MRVFTVRELLLILSYMLATERTEKIKELGKTFKGFLAEYIYRTPKGAKMLPNGFL